MGHCLNGRQAFCDRLAEPRRAFAPITALLALPPLPRITLTSPEAKSTSFQFKATTSPRLNPLSTIKSNKAWSLTLHACTTLSTSSAVNTGKRFFATFGITNFINSGIYPSACQNIIRVRIALAWSYTVVSDLPLSANLQGIAEHIALKFVQVILPLALLSL